jgi:hypothetical protein
VAVGDERRDITGVGRAKVVSPDQMLAEEGMSLAARKIRVRRYGDVFVMFLSVYARLISRGRV